MKFFLLFQKLQGGKTDGNLPHTPDFREIGTKKLALSTKCVHDNIQAAAVVEKLDEKKVFHVIWIRNFPLCGRKRRRRKSPARREKMCSPFIMSTVEIVLRPNISFSVHVFFPLPCRMCRKVKYAFSVIFIFLFTTPTFETFSHISPCEIL